MHRSIATLFSLTVLLGPVALKSRTQAPAPAASTAARSDQLSPQAAYTDALQPLESTRRNIANWSDVELAAMSVAVARARDACAARHPSDYAGADLIDLARLCSLGQQWPAVLDAAGRYIHMAAQPRPLLADALIAQTEAHLRLRQEPEALQSELALLQAVPYTPDVGDCTDEVLAYMRFVHTGDALQVARARQPLLLRALAARAGPATPATPPAEGAQTAATALATADGSSTHALFVDGLLLPALLQLAAKPDEATAAFAELQRALPSTLSPDDDVRIDAARRGYALLGKPLTGVTPLTSLSSPVNKLPQLPAHQTITALLLFPDWCATCIRLGPRLPETVFKVEGHSAYLYALLAQTTPPRTPDPKMTNTAFNPAYAAAMLAETPTVTVSPETLARFEATDYPLLLLTDADGILRVLQPVTAQDLQPGGDVDAAIALVGRNFGHAPAPATAAPSSTP